MVYKQLLQVIGRDAGNSLIELRAEPYLGKPYVKMAEMTKLRQVRCNRKCQSETTREAKMREELPHRREFQGHIMSEPAKTGMRHDRWPRSEHPSTMQRLQGTDDATKTALDHVSP